MFLARIAKNAKDAKKTHVAPCHDSFGMLGVLARDCLKIFANSVNGFAVRN